MKPTKMVTFQTRLDPKGETPKAYKIAGGEWYPKSLVSFELIKEVTMPIHYGQPAVRQLLGMITMPEWLAKR